MASFNIKIADQELDGVQVVKLHTVSDSTVTFYPGEATEKTVTPNDTEQIIEPGDNERLTKVTVAPVPNTYGHIVYDGEKLIVE